MCTKVTEIRMDRNEKKCFKDLPILFKPKNYGELEFHFQKGFLTYNNIIKNESIEINCVNINENIILPSNKQLIIRQGNDVKIINTSHIIIHDIATPNVIHKDINFKHQTEIINNYVIQRMPDEFDIGKRDDTQGNFYLLPNDLHRQMDSPKTQETENKIFDLKQYILGTIFTSQIVDSIIGALVSVIFIIIIAKIILIIIHNTCTRPTTVRISPTMVSQHQSL